MPTQGARWLFSSDPATTPPLALLLPPTAACSLPALSKMSRGLACAMAVLALFMIAGGLGMPCSPGRRHWAVGVGMEGWRRGCMACASPRCNSGPSTPQLTIRIPLLSLLPSQALKQAAPRGVPFARTHGGCHRGTSRAVGASAPSAIMHVLPAAQTSTLPRWCQDP